MRDVCMCVCVFEPVRVRVSVSRQEVGGIENVLLTVDKHRVLQTARLEGGGGTLYLHRAAPELMH